MNKLPTLRPDRLVPRPSQARRQAKAALPLSIAGLALSAVLRFGRRHQSALAICAGAGAVFVLAATMPDPPHARAAEAPASAAGTSSGAGQNQDQQNQVGQKQAGRRSAGSQVTDGQSSGSGASGKQTSGETGGAAAKPGSGETAKATEKARVEKALAQADKRLADLKSSLGITASETSSWHAFVQVARDHAEALASIRAKWAAELPHMNAVQNIESYTAITAKEADDMNALSAAFHTLYGKLTKSQQSAADEVFRQQAEKQAGIRLGLGRQ